MKCETCRRFFPCRFCHDLTITEESSHSLATGCCTETTKHNCEYHKVMHSFDRFNVKQIRCKLCHNVQQPGQRCSNCQISFGKYCCSVCNIYDNDTSKKQFHCKSCGLCRTGGRESFFHCDSCNACISIEMKDQHKHIADVMMGDCPICLEDMFKSRD